MKVRNNNNPATPLFILFVLLNAFFFLAKNLLSNLGADHDLLLGGNLFIFLVTIISFLLARRGINHPNPHAFVRGVYTSILLKLFIFLIAAFAYIATVQKQINKPAFFTLMGLYLTYTFIEVMALTKMLKNTKDA